MVIRLIKIGHYVLFETKTDTKILRMDETKSFAFIFAQEIGEILVSSKNTHKINCVLSRGNYRMYEVINEPNLTDLTHLELFVGEGHWQGYLLPNNMPGSKKKRTRIIPTKEVITKTSL
ncbi:MAG TPA: hypothetical protein PKA38_04470 [Candidatus Levybacteria bacterium]|nr:hypothetical protein [Candidatus Levybacteria bacterium]